MSQPRPSVDLIGRILSIVSLVAAVGVAGYVFMQQKQVTTDTSSDKALLVKFGGELDGLKETHKQRIDTVEQEFRDELNRNDQRMTDWNNQLVAAIKEIKQDADKTLAKFTAAEKIASEGREIIFRDAMTRYQGSQVSDAGKKSGDSEDVFDMPEFNMPEFNDPADAAAALLTLADTVLSGPTTGRETFIRIENKSGEEAVIRRIRFKPESDFRVKADDDAQANLKNTDTVVTFAYDTSDNTSTKSGQHGVYDRALSNPIRVPAGGDVTFRVIISDEQYLGWGFAGRLVLDYNSDEPLVVKAARVHFTKRDEDLVDRST